MEEAGGTASLRKAAAHWSLAGDKQLLGLLQNLHERIVTKCQEANSSLEEMVNTLDTASISLQNVNNRLMALSNSQFVESRVYDDDVDVASHDAPVKEPPKPSEPSSELSKLRDSLRVLEAYHEPVHIVDSDSDSASDEEEDRMVFKPRDLYAERPLPHVIGSQQWRSKWHAGLVAEESDSDSDTSKANPPSEQYSDSEPDRDDARVEQHKPHVSQRTISTNSSIGSELTIPTVGKPADIAAELARRLGGNAPRIPDPEPESPPTTAAPPKTYKPQQPAPATVFADEPPPLDQYQSDHSDQAYQSDSGDDIFAELHRNSHRHAERAAGGLVEQLFGNVSNVSGHKGGVEDHEDKGRQSNTSNKQPSPLFDDQEDSDLFADTSKSGQKPVDTEPEASIKKPVGGISLFGNNKGAESIGAAILKRNQRKVSTSDEEVDEPQQTSKVNDYTEKDIVRAENGSNIKEKNQKDIINDLFSKSNKPKPTNTRVEKLPSVNVEKSVNKKVDLFTDDLFDDIDDIFTTVKPPLKETKQSMKKSLFDDEDDELFANVASSSSKAVPKNRGIFDSDDDLFGEENVDSNAVKLSNSTTNTNPIRMNNDGLFSAKSDINKGGVTDGETKPVDTSTIMEPSTSKYELEDNETVINSEAIHKEVKPIEGISSAKGKKVESIFESDSDDEMFSERKSANIESNSSTQINKYNIGNETKSHSATDDNTHREFISSNDSNNENKTIKSELPGDDSLFKQIAKTKVDSTVSAQYLTPQNKNHNIRNNLHINQLEDNNKYTENLTENIEVQRSGNNSGTIYSKDKLLSNTNENDDRIKNRESTTIFNTPNLLKSQYQSPSLFDDDELDDMFSKIPHSNDSEEMDNKQSNTISAQSSEYKHIVNNSDFLHTKEFNEAYTTVTNTPDVDIANKETEVNKSDKNIIKQNTQGLNNISTDLKADRDINVIGNNSQETKATETTDCNVDYSKSITEEPMHEEINKNKTDYLDITAGFIQKESLLSNVEEADSGEPDIFSDIFSDIPPEFERPKEPKRSKNVNALFDDDSDDEALFFKKNENITDEKPDVSFSSQDDGLFHIFHDEPPAMDVDFTQKSKKSVSPTLQTQSSESYSENINSKADTYKQTNVKSLLSEETQKKNRNNFDPESEKNVDEAKKPVGKLKTMNFNINVSTLLPGASPKKTKAFEQVDGQVISTKRTEDIVKDEESKMVKSVSFDGDPESEILDNKASKERARIQVKRRPSSRRARKEAVRKSGIDFGDDSTDNSSSTDISKKDNVTDNMISPQVKEGNFIGEVVTEDEANSNNNVLDHNEFTDESLPDILVEKIANSKEEPNESKLFNNIETNIGERTMNNENSPSVSNLTTAFNKRPNVKSKVVYILNDEDIFTDTKPIASLSDHTQNQTGNSQSFTKNKVLNVVDDDDELFKSGASRNTNISTIGNVYKDVNLKNTEIDNFDSNEDIFIASQSNLVKHTEVNTKSSNNKDEIDKLEAKIDKLFVKTQSKVKTSLFDDLSDDESELFGSKKSIKISDTFDGTDGMSTAIKKEVKLPKKDAKRPLFSDESDNDDLFGVRTVRKEPSSQPLSKPKEVISKPSEPVFEDPLSLLGQEDDM